MPYRVIKNNRIIGNFPSLAVDAGVLKGRNALGGVIDYYAPGTWDHAYWEEDEDA